MHMSRENDRTVLLAVLAGLCESADETVKHTADKLRIKLIAGIEDLSKQEKTELISLLNVEKLKNLDGGATILKILNKEKN